MFFVGLVVPGRPFPWRSKTFVLLVRAAAAYERSGKLRFGLVRSSLTEYSGNCGAKFSGESPDFSGKFPLGL
jgi:hypothetical protein